jgi:polysaccharide export outer membrane protein
MWKSSELLISLSTSDMEPKETGSGRKILSPCTISTILAGAIITLLAVIVLCGCGSSQPTRRTQLQLTRGDSLARSGDFLARATVVRRGDQIRLRSPEYPEIDTTITVTEEGTISLRLGGTVAVIGLTKADLITTLVAKISPFVRTKFSLIVDVFNPASQNVTVLGSVDRQGNFPMLAGSSILQALAAAGGASPDADLHHIKIFRRGDPAYPIEIDLAEYLASGEINAIPTLSPGDMVYVPKEENFVRELSAYLRDAIFLFSVFTIAR